MNNPFPHPSTISTEINDEIMLIIREQFRLNNKIEFFDMMKFLENAIEEKNYEKSQICAYYCVNVILNNHNLNDTEKNNLICGITMSVNELKQDS